MAGVDTEFAIPVNLDVHLLTIIMSGRYPVIASMNSTNTDVIQGTLDMLILKTLSLEPMHGFGIVRRIEQITQNVFKVNAGSLLTALQRLERYGWLAADWVVTQNSRRAKVYRLTQMGRKQLQNETADWQRRSAAISRLLKAQA
jgi:transcriptional regulator